MDAGQEAAAPVAQRRRRVGFFAMCLAYCAIILDGSVLNVAIPTIRHDLGSPMAGAQWVLNGYTLPLAALLLTAGALGDRVGMRRMLLGGIALFTAASAACAAAPDIGALIAARAVQGVGAAALLPATLAMIPHLFASRADQARAAVTWVAAGTISVAAGPLVGGLLIEAFGWRSIFLINLPVGVVERGAGLGGHPGDTAAARAGGPGRAGHRRGCARPADRGPDPGRLGRLGRARHAGHPGRRDRGRAGVLAGRAVRAGTRCCRCRSSPAGCAPSR